MNPYETLPQKSFWKLSITSKSMFDIDELWDPKFDIYPDNRVVSFGSCFAQHIGVSLKNRGFNWLVVETPPDGLSEKNIKLLNYNVFSARTGNIYTTSLLKQWVQWSLGKSDVPGEVWEKESRFYDPFRPRIEPDGFESGEETRQSQSQAIGSFGDCIRQAEYFVFTLGLTESWVNEEGYEYPMCPGTVAGDFEPKKHKFKNQRFNEVLQNLSDAISLMQNVNPNLKFILTVSPIPLTATRSDNHVLVATMESKSILRAVAGELAADSRLIDYFPSYEIVNSPVYRGIFFEPNLRSINPYGTNFVMDIFFECLKKKFGEHRPTVGVLPTANVRDVCDEELLEAFGKQ